MPVCEEPEPQEHCENVCESEKELEEKLNVEKDMSKRENDKIENDKSKMTKEILEFRMTLTFRMTLKKGFFVAPKFPSAKKFGQRAM
jgi:ASC-1-like (ASCH) protein